MTLFVVMQILVVSKTHYDNSALSEIVYLKKKGLSDTMLFLR